MSVALNFTDTGGQDRALVILHGLFGSLDNWRSHIRHWRKQRRVVAIDLRNHGRSPHADGMGYDAMAEDVLGLLDRLDIEQCDLLGHSMGGKVAMTLARRWPERIARLIVADIAPIEYDHDHDEILAAMRHVEDVLPKSRRDADEAMQQAVSASATRQFLATNLIRDDQGVLIWRVGLDQIEADYASIMAAPGGDRAFKGPTLVLRGANSDYVADSTLDTIHDVLPNARVETVDQAGHWLHAEQPEAFQAAVERFLSE